MNIQDSKVEPDAAINIKIMNSDTNSDNSVPHSLVLASFVCLLASAFYFYEFILQVSPSVMTHQLMKAYSVGAAGLGTISAFYFYAYAPMQLPAGMLYDRFGPRTLLPITVLICAIGTLLFSMTHSAFLAAHGRFLIGLGSAFSFTGTLILISRWFPPQYFALLAGITQSMSSAGAIFGQAPLAHAITHYGWRQSLVGLSVAGFILALFMWLFIRDYPRGQRISRAERRASTDTKGGLRFVLHNKQSWYIAIYGFTIWASIVTFAGLWGVPYVKAVYHISTAGASAAISMVLPFGPLLSPLLAYGAFLM